MKKKTLQELCRRAVKLGAKDARVIPAATIKTAAWVRSKCQFGCDGFAGCLTCPPYSPLPEVTRKIIAFYKKAILVHATSRIGADISEIVVKLEREAFLSGYYKAFAMGAGPCRLCRECNMDAGCRHADRARPSMEACGIDVFSTARANGFPIETVKSLHDKANYYGVVLIE